MPDTEAFLLAHGLSAIKRIDSDIGLCYYYTTLLR